MKLSKQLAILVALCAIGLLLLSLLSLNIIKSNLTDSRKHEVESVLTLAKAQVSVYVDAAQKGLLSRQEAEKKVIEVLTNIRAGDSYIWANGSDAISKVHPNPEQLGSFQSGYSSSLKALQNVNFVFSDGDYPKAGAQGLYRKINGMTKIPEWNWVFGYGVYVEDLEEDFQHTVVEFSIVGAIILVVIIFAAVILARTILTNILKNIGGEPKYVTSVTNKIAAGNLNEPIVGTFDDDSLLASVSKMQSSLKEMVNKIKNGSTLLTRSAKQLDEQMTNIAMASARSAESAHSNTVAIQQLSTSIEEIADSVHQTEQNSSQSYEFASNAETAILKSASSVQEISTEITSSADEILSLQKRSVEIDNIAKVIREIADQTNLLALNAAIEAARAGEYGRGFSVVADEVRTLASRTATATAEITDTINFVRSDTETVSTTMNAVLPKVEANVASSNEVSEILANIRSASSETLTKIREVSNASEEQTKATQSLATNAEDISSTMKETNNAITRSKESTDELNQLAQDLQETVSYFKV